MSNMKLDVSKAFVRPMIEFPFEIDVPLETQLINGDQVRFEPVHLQGTYVMNDDIIRLKGEMSAVAHAPCAVCLKEVEICVAVDFEETFQKDADEEEDGTFRYEGKQLELDHMTLTLVMLNMPMRFTCQTQCQAEAELTAWNEGEKIWAEEEEETAGTYRPFEGLKDLLEKQEH